VPLEVRSDGRGELGQRELVHIYRGLPIPRGRRRSFAQYFS
jgi:hypothetical protein